MYNPLAANAMAITGDGSEVSIDQLICDHTFRQIIEERAQEFGCKICSAVLKPEDEAHECVNCEECKDFQLMLAVAK